MDCSPPGPSVHGIFQARVLEWGAIAFSALSDLHICNTVLLTGVVMRYITFLWFSFLKITIYFWLYSVFIAGWGLLSGCGVWASHCSGFSHCGPQTLGMQAWVVSARGLSSYFLQAPERRLSSCGAWVLLPRGVWDLPRPGTESESPELAVRFLTSGLPGKPWPIVL